MKVTCRECRPRRLFIVSLLAALSACQPSAPAPAEESDTAVESAVDPYWSVAELRGAMTAGDVTATEVVQASLDRIIALDDEGPRLRAVIAVDDAALEQAAQADLDLPLGGVPVLVKANIDMGAVLPTHAGALAIADHYAPDEAFLVQQLRRAGALVIGTTNLSEWANFRDHRSVSGWSGVGGQTKNPYVLNRNPCGSSSGSAVAVAAGFVPIAIGTETHGSVVCPAGANGVVGIKPTLGLVSRDGIIPIAASQDTAGPMARSVADAAAALQAIAVQDPRDPAAAAHRGVTDMLAYLQADALAGARVGVWRRYYGAGNFPGVEALYESALVHLTDAGAVLVDPVGLSSDDEMVDASYQVLLHEFQAGLRAYAQGAFSLDDVIAFNRRNRAAAMPWFGQSLLLESREAVLTDDAYAKQLAAGRGEMRNLLRDTFEKFDLDFVVAPTNAPAATTDVVLGDRFGLSSSSLAALSGRPAVTLPMGDVQGLPVGISLLGQAWQDARLLGYAHALELRLPARLKPEFVPALEP
ncbi:MAG: amidase [Pseudomonadota bacterium]